MKLYWSWRSADEVDALHGMFHRRRNFLNAVPIARISPDPGDGKFIACAIAGKADFLVTGNKRHFPQRRQTGAKVVSAGELLEFITLEL